jgi:hypothetical protein
VKRIGRVLLLALGAMIAVAAVMLLAVNMHVQSQATHARIERELSERLGTSLRIRRISVTPWKGLALTGITIPQTIGGGGTQFLEAESFELRVRYLSLFSQRLVIKEVSLIEPKVTWYQNADGEWRLPPPIAAPPAPRDFAPAGEAGSVPSSSARDASSGSHSTAAPAQTRPSTFTPEVRRVNLVDGSFRFFDARGRPIAAFDEVQFHSNFRNTAEVRGNIAIAKASLRDRFFLQHVQARLAYGPAALELADMKASAAGGHISGRFNMEPKSADSPFVANVKFEALDANRVVTEAGGSSGTISGHFDGFLDASGKTADPNALAGAGEVVLRGGQLRQYSLLSALGQMLQIAELQQLQLDDAHVKYHITPGMIAIDELLLRSPNIRVSAIGTVFFDGRLQLQSQLAIDEEIRKQLFRPVRDNFQPVEEPGFAAVAFQVGGTVERPTSDLLEKLVGRDLKDIGSAISGLLGGHEKKPKPKKNEPPRGEEPPPSPTISATP